MKKICLLLFLLGFCIINAQESQEVAASKWKDGMYEYYHTNLYNNLKWEMFNIKHKLAIKRNAKNKVVKISLKGDPSIGDYIHTDSASTDFVRHYSGNDYNDKKLYFNENCIIAYRLKQITPKPEIEMNYCIGKNPGDGIKDEIISYLEKTMSYYIPSSVSKSNEIEKITAVIISDDDELSSGTYIDLGLVFKMKWGVEVKSKNLGGNIDIKNFTITSNQLKKVPNRIFWEIDCSKTINKEMEIVVWLNYYPSDKFKTLIPVKCDTENSPVVKMSKILSDYEEVRYSELWNGKKEIKVLKKLPETGYSTYPIDLLKIYKKKEIATDLIRVKKDNKIGYIDKNGKIIIPVEFEDGTVDNFTSGLIGVKKGNKCGFMTLKNTIGVPFDYDMVWAYNGNIAKIKNEGKFGYINLQGKVIAKPIYDEVWGLTNGVILVKKDSKYGYITETGVVVTNTIYDVATEFSSAEFGTVLLNNKIGCIDKTGKIVVPIEFQKSPVSLNKDLFKVYKDGKWGILKKDGKMLFDYTYDEISVCGTDNSKNPGECVKYIRVKRDGLFGFVTTDGKVFKDCIYNTADDFYGNMAAITKTENGVEKRDICFLMQVMEKVIYTKVGMNLCRK
ncbi:MAG: WG repeat-containing protein [Sphingobacteriaceae bacterium]|nr:WG repeat-containing protein [Sphingobacteriaceae bacterium]